MTIKEFYEWAKEKGYENFKMFTEVQGEIEEIYDENYINYVDEEQEKIYL